MDEQGIWKRLTEMYDSLGTWDAVARTLGISKQYLSYCVTRKRVTRKLLEAMDLEARYVRTK